MAQTNVQAFSGDVAISSNLAVDTNTLFVDSVGNNVGIGTTSPTDRLDVHYPTPTYGATGNEEGSLTVSAGGENSNAAVYFRTPHSAAAPAKMAIFSSGGNHSGATNGGLHFCVEDTADNTTKVSLNNSRMVIKSDGNVGIGKTNPGSALDVVGTVTATTFSGKTVGTHYGTISGSNAAAVSSLTASGQVKGATVVGTSGVYGTISGSNTAAVSSLTASGQVKGATVVGTSGVYGKIMGSNTAAVTTLTASGVIAGATGVNGTPLVLNVGRGDVTFEYNTYDRGNDDGAGITIRTSANPVLDSMFAVRSSGHASRLWVGQDLTSVGSNQLCAGFSGADGTEGVLDSYKFIVKTNGDVAISSNLAVDTNTLFVDSVGNKVGIGTANPETKLHVKGGSICVHRTFPDTPDAGIVFMEDHANKDCMFIAYDGGGVAETDDESLRFYSKSAGGADPTITGANLLMCMRADGNVGIGTTSPGSTLDVVGDVAISSTLDVVGDVAISSNLAVDTNTLFVDSVGNKVGIGMTSPFRALDVSTTGSIAFGSDISEATERGLYWQHDSDYAIYRTGGGWDSPNFQQLLLKWTTGIVLQTARGTYGRSFVGVDDRMSIGSSYYTTKSPTDGLIVQGNVGIGTTNPQATLDVVAAGGYETSGGIGHRNSIAVWDHIYMTNDGSNAFLLAGGCAAIHIGVANENAVDDGYGAQAYNGIKINDGATSVSAWSDVRMKTKIEALSDVIASIAKLDTIKYNLKSDFAHKKKLIGVVGQNIEKYFPDLVTETKDGEISVDYGELPVILLRAIQELQSDINRNNRAIIEDTSEDITGLLVSKNNDKYINTYNKIVSVPRVSLSNVYNDKRCIGVVSDIEKPDDRDKHYEEFDKISEKDINDTLVFIHSTGSGKIWVTDMNGNLEIGDYLTTSNISGYGTKQSDDILHSYTVAKISVDCDFLESFNNVEQPIKVTRDVDLWVKDNWVPSTEEEHCRLNECECRVMKETYYTDGTSNVCVDEYSNLESNVQSTYTEQSRQVYTRQRSIETTIDPGKPTYKMTKIERAFNAIDEDGKLVWEVADEKQSSYQLRYLDEIGNLTDKANAVYKAALVDCNFTST